MTVLPGQNRIANNGIRDGMIHLDHSWVIKLQIIQVTRKDSQVTHPARKCLASDHKWARRWLAGDSQIFLCHYIQLWHWYWNWIQFRPTNSTFLQFLQIQISMMFFPANFNRLSQIIGSTFHKSLCLSGKSCMLVKLQPWCQQTQWGCIVSRDLHMSMPSVSLCTLNLFWLFD